MRNSLVWSEELARYLFIWLIYIGISYGAKIMKHIKIEAALGLFPKKVRPVIVIIGDILFLGFSLFICAAPDRFGAAVSGHAYTNVGHLCRSHGRIYAYIYQADTNSHIQST